MSASKDKLLRKQQSETGQDKRALAAEKEAKERRKNRITYITVAVVIVVLFAFIFFYNSALPSRLTNAVTIDGQKYSVAQTNYYFNTAYAEYYNDNIMDILTGNSFDTSVSLADQQYDDTSTWRDFFLERTVDKMEEIQLLNDRAAAEGFTLDEEQQADLDSSIQDLQDNWSAYGYASLQQYLNLNYGKGVNMALFTEGLRCVAVADAYKEALRDSYEYTDSELDAAYAESADDLDGIHYAYLIVDDTFDADAVVAAVDGTDEETFTAYMEDNYDGATPTTALASGEDLSEVYASWLLDSARQPGDASLITSEDDSTSYVVMFLDRDAHDYPLVSFRHVLLNAEDTDGDGEYSEEELAEAEARAQALLDEWLAGDATEDSFAELANANSEDTGSNTTGGLYEDVYKGRMVENIDSWLFEDGRQPGDTVVVTNDGSYTGAHIVYYVGAADDTYAHELAKDLLSEEQYDAWLADETFGMAVTTAHMDQVGKTR